MNKDQQVIKALGYRASNGFDSKAELEEQHLHDVIMTTFMNPLILNCIFTKLDINDLKTIRQVCSLWEDVGASALGDKTMIKVYEDRPNPQLNDPNFNLQLVKHINISVVKGGLSEVTKYAQFLQPIDKVVESISISTTLELMSFFVDVMIRYEFPNLHSICVFSTSRAMSWDRKRPARFSSWRVRPTVKIVQFIIYGPGSEPFHPILQSLVDSSPNMDELHVMGNLYPDLSHAAKLTSLRYGTWRDPDMSKVKAVLTSTRERIVKLDIDNRGPNEKHDHQEFCLPLMPNLVNLSVYDCDMYRFQASLCEDCLPKLKHLFLSSPSTNYTVRHFVENLWQCHNGVVSLKTCTDAGPSLIKRFAELFPNVQKLDVKLAPIGLTEDWKEVVKSYGAWKKLKQSSVEFLEIKNVAQIEQALEGMSAWGGSKCVTFVATVLKGGAIKRFTETTKAAFLLCKEFESVKFSGFKGSTALAEEIQAFINEYKLPIYFEKRMMHY